MTRLLPALLALVCITTIHAQHNNFDGSNNIADRNSQAPPQCIPSNLDGTCDNPKVSSMEFYRARTTDGDLLTTNQGVKIADNQNSLHAGERGPTLLEDFIFREKITHFDHERIPERAVHARGAAAHGYFQVYQSLANITKANFLQDPSKITPVFVRFSTVGGARGSADTVRDVRGFATKFYTEEGNFDLVGNNMPIFFIQDAIKFPDFVHSVKPEPHNEMPQASSAHDNLYDFVTQQTETTHMMMWLMSDRAIPRSYSTMEGFGIHTFRLINAQGRSRFVKFHWKPKLGVHSLVWDENQKLAGKNSDFHRQQMWESIEAGNYLEWELGLQIVEEGDELKYGFDILDPTKLIPEELVPVQIVGRMVLNRNPDNYFAETEQVAFLVSNIVPGIDFSNDPLMQGRLFSYLDTQLLRLGGPNFHELPINRPICPFKTNNQRDGIHRQTVNVGKTNYDINTINKGLPRQATPAQGGFTSYTEHISANKIRGRSSSFSDHFSQATLFWNSMSPVEKSHIVSAFSFELSKVALIFRQRMLQQLQRVDGTLAQQVADNLGLQLGPRPAAPTGPPPQITVSPSLSQMNTKKDSIVSRQVAILAADGIDGQAIADLKAAIQAAGGSAKVIAPRMGTLRVSAGQPVEVDGILVANPSILFDAVFIPGGADGVKRLQENGDAVHYALEAYIHFKPIAAAAEGVQFLSHIGLISKSRTAALPEGLFTADTVTDEFKQTFVQAVAQHRFFNRERTAKIPA
ncbi:Catalase HPII [Hypsibius exemplaris]|uniref:Catalase n=1 Tax=Hypsibius exemplaris TaxID=2072580 RepID=A0A1W0X3V9_HYPEX|nr:Catalase HPII [Hypsibius exemplaris]